MSLPKNTQNKLQKLLKNSRSFQALSEKEQKDKEEKLLLLPEERVLAVIQALEEEQAKVVILEQKLADCEKELTQLIPLLKQASTHLQKAFITLREKKENVSDETQKQHLLEELENM